MKITILTAVLGGQLLLPVADTLPVYKVDESCKGAMSAMKSEAISDAQTYASCVKDEEQARQELVPVWLTYSPAARTQCDGEASAGGLPSYVDLLVCLQMAKDVAVTPATATKLRGASKKKRKS